MIADEAQIERIVRQVLDRARQLGTGDASPAAIATSAAIPGQLVLAASVVTLETLDRQLDGIQRVVVPKAAIVTPAASDALADRDIELSRCDSVTGSTATRTQTRPIIAAATDSESLKRIVQLVGDGVSNVDTVAVGSLVETTIGLCKKLESSDDLGVLLTEDTAAAVCLANRHRHIRAAQVADAHTARDAVESFAANLIVINPCSATDFQMKRIVQTVQQATPTARCGELKSALNQAR